jgi:hypothetical protein
MDWFWNWGGACFGATACSLISARKSADSTGRKFLEAGRYLGEVMSENRLITSRSKKSWVRGSFMPRSGGSTSLRRLNFWRTLMLYV